MRKKILDQKLEQREREMIGIHRCRPSTRTGADRACIKSTRYSGPSWRRPGAVPPGTRTTRLGPHPFAHGRHIVVTDQMDFSHTMRRCGHRRPEAHPKPPLGI
jgi:hypothetical protein